MMTIAALEAAELATVLAALRFYQEEGRGDPANRSDAIHDIATACDEVTSLDASAIDALCERLNTSPPRGALQSLIDHGLSFADVVPLFAEHQRTNEPHLTAYVDGADNLKIVRDGELEIDGDAIVSKGSDGGAYVMAWLYVEDEDAGITTAEEDDEEDDEED